MANQCIKNPNFNRYDQGWLAFGIFYPFNSFETFFPVVSGLTFEISLSLE